MANLINNQSNDCNDIVSIHSSEIAPIENKDYKCAPSKKFEHGSCIPLNLLVEMANAYNSDNTANQIKLCPTKETLNPPAYKRYLIKEFKKKLDKVCTNQECWTKQKFMQKINEKYREELQNNTFRPKGPDGKFTWLDTSNIIKVMEQYELKYKDFKFLGAVPMDFEDLEQLQIKNIDFNQLLTQGKSRFGMIINTDNHDQGGTHWISLFIDLKKGQVYFSDSVGEAPPERVRKFMSKISRFIRDELKIKPDVRYNKLQHQRKGSECGIYSMNWILRLLRGDTFEELTTKRLSDETVNQCRQYYFAT